MQIWYVDYNWNHIRGNFQVGTTMHKFWLDFIWPAGHMRGTVEDVSKCKPVSASASFNCYNGTFTSLPRNRCKMFTWHLVINCFGILVWSWVNKIMEPSYFVMHFTFFEYTFKFSDLKLQLIIQLKTIYTLMTACCVYNIPLSLTHPGTSAFEHI